jgi:transcriptional regulator with XRE-family HTH domain
MATAPIYFSDQAVKDYIANQFGGLTGDALYTAVAKEAAAKGVSAEQIGRVLGFDTSAVNQYATNVAAPLVAEKQALAEVIDYAYNTQFGRDATAQEAENAAKYLTEGGSSGTGTGVLNQSLEGYNYDTQSIISGYRSTLGRNPTQTEYVSAMATLGYDPFNPTVLGEAGKLSANVAALESDPFAGRYANENPYGVYDPITMTYKLDATLPNISQTVQGNSVQFISPVTQRPITTSFENGKLVVKDGVNTLTGEQAQSAINLALNTGALTATEYKNLTGSLATAKSMEDVYKAFGTPQAVAALDPNYGFQLGVGKTLAQAQENSAGVQALVDQAAAANGGRLPANFSVANLAKTAGVPFQFGQDVYDKSFKTDIGTPITTMARTPTAMYNPATPNAPFNFNPANIYQAPITAGQMRELFPSFGESKRLAQGLINERPSTQSIVRMIQGAPVNTAMNNLTAPTQSLVPTGLNTATGLQTGLPTGTAMPNALGSNSLSNILSMIAR